MTPYRVLYFPDFSPEPAWLRRILLLTDEVVRIVPLDVDLQDEPELQRLQEVMPGCLSRVAPEPDDTAMEPADQGRLALAFQRLKGRGRGKGQTVDLLVGRGGRLSIAGHVFVHDSKLSHFVQSELRRAGLVLDGLQDLGPSERFLVVRREASELILSGLAARVGSRLGIDAITDKPAPFALSALRGIPAQRPPDGVAEGALLSAIATTMIPGSVARIDPRRYRELRASYDGVREAFKSLIVELAAGQRLNRIHDPSEWASRVADAASGFGREYRKYRQTRYARAFRSWFPLAVGGVLQVGGAMVNPLLGAAVAVASVAVQVLEKLSDRGEDDPHRVFHMLSGMRRDIIKISGVKELV